MSLTAPGVCALAAAPLLLVACGASPGALDAGSDGGLVSTDAGASDAGWVSPVDGGPSDAGAVDGGAQDAGPCGGDCGAFDIVSTFGATVERFTRAQFGLTSPAHSGGGWELYLELHAGGSPECPTQSSPTPDRTLIVTGRPLPLQTGVASSDGGLRVTLLDFEGTQSSEFPARADLPSMDVKAHHVCEACVSGEMFVRFELDARFDGGVIRGPGFATHCASLDLR